MGRHCCVFETLFLMRDVAKQGFHLPRLRYIYVDLGIFQYSNSLDMVSSIANNKKSHDAF